MRQKISFINIFMTFSIIFILWKIASLGAASPILPSPEAVFIAFLNEAENSLFWIHFGISAWRVCASIFLSWIIAFPLGAILGYSPLMDRIFSPLVYLAYPVPKMVLLPVVVLLFGLGDLSKIILITLILFFQILVAVRDGVRSVSPKYYDSVESMGGSVTDIFRHVVIPAALPHSFTAIRISTGTAISVLFFAESFATSSGLGYLIMDAWARADYIMIFVGITGMSLMGLILFIIFSLLEKKLCSWNFTMENDKSPENGLLVKTVTYSKMIKLSHTIFALPFALSGLVLALREHPVTFQMVFWIVIAMVGARSAAMGFNRIADAEIDAENPRTAIREIPSGTISRKEAMAFTIFSSLLLIFAAAMLSEICLWLSVPLLAFLFFYSYTKRFTWLAHIYLGFAIGTAPAAVWIAIAGVPDLSIIILALALMTHIAGFDILYSCQDVEFDKEKNLFSIPARFGVKKAFFISAVLHITAVALLSLLYFTAGFGVYYFIFTSIIAVLYIIEHKIINPDDITHINIAFFHINSIISVAVFFAVLTGYLTGR
ncbi:MAG TPA: UbiA-like polyprenyltransferase [Spirochaetota bacterium]|nr:UbiA-like polyprenyltransferase [Spirochaetota bacterium]HPS86563.1 UbiA-like polyprenyltransferase [Spirochaetota bacterium]